MASFNNKKELKFVITLGKAPSNQAPAAPVSVVGSGTSSNPIQIGTIGSVASAQVITLQGHRAVVDIDKAGGMMMGTLRATIYGVTQSDMNSCVTFPYQPQRFAQGNVVKLNGVQVFAIDGAQETLIFTGNIINAWGNYQNMPDVFLTIQAMSTAIAQLTPIPPNSYNGAIDAATIMEQLAAQMGFTFENNGVTAQLSNQYLANTGLDQAKTVQRAAGIDMYIDNSILAITPPNAPRNTPTALISAQTGMIGYPTFDGFGVNFQMLFNPSVVFGGSIQIQSDIPQANGLWIVRSIAYRLESEKPDGAWFATVRGTSGNLSIKGAAQ